MDVGLDARVAEGANEDGIEIAREHGESIGRDGGLVAQITVRTPIEIGEFDRRPGRPDDANCLRNHFFTNTVAGDHGDALFR